MSHFFDRPRVKWTGAVALAFLVGVALGNGWTTTAAVEGANRWWAGQQHQVIKAHAAVQREKDRQDCYTDRL